MVANRIPGKTAQLIPNLRRDFEPSTTRNSSVQSRNKSNPLPELQRSLTENLLREKGFTNPYLFTGQPLDVIDSGSLYLYHYRARAYDPTHGRFLQRDPLGTGDRLIWTNIRHQGPLYRPFFFPLAQYYDGMNLYGYVKSCPTKFVDWAGKRSDNPNKPDPKDECKVCCKAIIEHSNPYAGGDGYWYTDPGELQTIEVNDKTTKAESCRRIQPTNINGVLTRKIWRFKHSGPCDNECNGQPKVPYWICTRPLDFWWGGIAPWPHTYICCDGPNGSHCRNFWKRPSGETVVSPEAITTGTCRMIMVCPQEKSEKCDGQNWKQPYDTIHYNCGHWAEDFGNVTCPLEAY